MATRRRVEGQGWEHSLMRWLTYPANLAFAGIAAFFLALPLVTALPAAVAAARSMNGWLEDDDTTVFTSTFREFGRTWRRTLPLGVVAAVVVAILAFDAVFLWAQLSAGTSGPALALGAATLPVALAVSLLLLVFPVAATRVPEGSSRDWLIESVYLITSRPLRSLFTFLICAALIATLTLLPTLVPFFGMSVPVYLALVALGRSPERGSAPTPFSRSFR